MTILTSQSFGLLLTFVALALCLASTVAVEGSRGTPEQRRRLLITTAVFVCVWGLVVLARFITLG